MQGADALLYQKASNDQGLKILDLAYCNPFFSALFHKQSETNMTLGEGEISSFSIPISSMSISSTEG